MNGVLEHPTRELLNAFSLGQLDEGELAAIEDHLARCNACREAAENAADDTLIALLRSAATEPNSDTGAHCQAAPTQTDPGGPVRTAADLAVPPALVDHPRYRLLELLGVGGMGAVYKAEHLLMRRLVALKVVNPELIVRPATVERFQREARAAAQLVHPNIVTAFDAEQAGDAHYLVMEYVEGVSLARLVGESGPLAMSQACAYVRQAATGLQHAHERGMVHRDIKPQNLMLTPAGQVKILDFGLARFAMENTPALLSAAEAQPADTARQSSSAALTQHGIVMGTPDYIAPEQAKDSHTADIRADIYSL
ncbi:MAG TPA: protein kinase, partial [Gemmataceae bacterium]|nr:protein kinase [Gemmataceae bacterium]